MSGQIHGDLNASGPINKTHLENDVELQWQ
jgi:hypothetical protein